MKPNNTIQVSAIGVAYGAYDLVHFSLTVSDVAETGPAAKSKILEVSDNVVKYVDSLVEDRLAHNVVLAFSIEPFTAYKDGEKVFVGYVASHKITFSSREVELATSIQEKLTTFPQTKVAAISYTFSDHEKMRELAVSHAFELIQRRLTHQLSVLGLTTRYYRIVSWDVQVPHNSISKVSRPTDDTEGTAAVSVELTEAYEFVD